MVNQKIFLISIILTLSLLFLLGCQNQDVFDEIVDVEEESASFVGRATYNLPDCTEDDSGIDYSNVGTSSYSWGPSRTDTCIPASSQPERLEEYYCLSKQAGDYIARRVYDCASNGNICLDGACVAEPVNLNEIESCDGESICNEGALFCSTDNNLELLDDCQYGCEENNCLGPYEGVEPISGTCNEVLSNHNDLNDDRINIVFVGFNYNSLKELIYITEAAIDFDSNNFGIFSVEPFKSNKDKFNFWLVDEIQSADSGLSLNPLAPEIQRAVQLTLPNVCQFNNQFPIVLYPSTGGVAAFNGEAYVGVTYDDSLEPFPLCEESDVNNDGCVDSADVDLIEDQGLQIEGFNTCHDVFYGCHFPTIPDNLDVLYLYSRLQVVVHEFGHSFGILRDEYNTVGTSNFVGESSNNNCFVASSEQNCIDNAPWSDLIGQGCGDSSVVDCSVSDENYTMEISCFEGCDYATSGIYRPSVLSMMGGQQTGGLDVFNTEYSFRLVNERILCDRIAELTGSSSGYCDQFGS